MFFGAKIELQIRTMDSFEVDRIGHITDKVERYNLQTMRQEQTDG